MKPVLGMLIPGLCLFLFTSCVHRPLDETPAEDSTLSPVSETAEQSDDSEVRESKTENSVSDESPGSPLPEDSVTSADEPPVSEPEGEETSQPVQVSNDSIESTEEEPKVNVISGDGSFLPPSPYPGGQKKPSRDKEALEKGAAEESGDVFGEEIPEALHSDGSSPPPLIPGKSRSPGVLSEKAELPSTEDTPDIQSEKTTVPGEQLSEDSRPSVPPGKREDLPVDVMNPLLSDDIPYMRDSPLPADSLPPAESGSAPVPEIPDSPSPERDIRPGVQVRVIEESPDQFSGEAALPEKNAAQPSRWLDAPGEFTVTLDGRGWVFRSDLSSPGSWRFLERERDGESTRFRFLFDEKGQWSLVFERQDLSSGGSLRETRTVKVGDGESAIIENGPPGPDADSGVSGLLPGNPDERDSLARLAAETGRPDEAMALWERDAGRKDAAGVRARKGLVEQAIDAAAVPALVDWLPSYLEDGADPALLSDALNLLQEHAGYQSLETGILEQLVSRPTDPRRPEWLYRLARLLEEPGEGRNLDRAGALYTEVIEGWPYSDWSDLSEERLAWLRRYYFRVR